MNLCVDSDAVGGPHVYPRHVHRANAMLIRVLHVDSDVVDGPPVRDEYAVH